MSVWLWEREAVYWKHSLSFSDSSSGQQAVQRISKTLVIEFGIAKQLILLFVVCVSFCLTDWLSDEFSFRQDSISKSRRPFDTYTWYPIWACPIQHQYLDIQLISSCKKYSIKPWVGVSVVETYSVIYRYLSEEQAVKHDALLLSVLSLFYVVNIILVVILRFNQVPKIWLKKYFIRTILISEKSFVTSSDVESFIWEVECFPLKISNWNRRNHFQSGEWWVQLVETRFN